MNFICDNIDIIIYCIFDKTCAVPCLTIPTLALCVYVHVCACVSNYDRHAHACVYAW